MSWTEGLGNRKHILLTSWYFFFLPSFSTVQSKWDHFTTSARWKRSFENGEGNKLKISFHHIFEELDLVWHFVSDCSCAELHSSYMLQVWISGLSIAMHTGDGYYTPSSKIFSSSSISCRLLIKEVFHQWQHD